MHASWGLGPRHHLPHDNSLLNKSNEHNQSTVVMYILRGSVMKSWYFLCPPPSPPLPPPPPTYPFLHPSPAGGGRAGPRQYLPEDNSTLNKSNEQNQPMYFYVAQWWHLPMSYSCNVLLCGAVMSLSYVLLL